MNTAVEIVKWIYLSKNSWDSNFNKIDYKSQTSVRLSKIGFVPFLQLMPWYIHRENRFKVKKSG